MKIAFVGSKNKSPFISAERMEDQEILSFLVSKGCDIQAVIWDEEKDWKQYDLVLLKGTYDYIEKAPLFFSWLHHLEEHHIKVLNPPPLVRWNSNKQYLSDIQAACLPVIPTYYTKPKEEIDIVDLFERFEQERLVIKPAIGSSAVHTSLITRDNARTVKDQYQALLHREAFLIQPFMKEIQTGGEWSFVFFHGSYSHAVVKVPREGDYRIQREYGGIARHMKPAKELIFQAQKFIDSFAKDSLYARVDGLVIKGLLTLMELELIEPHLFFDKDYRFMENYYSALRYYL